LLVKRVVDYVISTYICVHCCSDLLVIYLSSKWLILPIMTSYLKAFLTVQNCPVQKLVDFIYPCTYSFVIFVEKMKVLFCIICMESRSFQRSSRVNRAMVKQCILINVSIGLMMLLKSCESTVFLL